MIQAKNATKIIAVLDEQIQEVKKVMKDDIGIRNVLIRRLQNCKNEVFLNSELYPIATGRRDII
jgi:hypothetical protein